MLDYLSLYITFSAVFAIIGYITAAITYSLNYNADVSLFTRLTVCIKHLLLITLVSVITPLVFLLLMVIFQLMAVIIIYFYLADELAKVSNIIDL